MRQDSEEVLGFYAVYLCVFVSFKNSFTPEWTFLLISTGISNLGWVLKLVVKAKKFFICRSTRFKCVLRLSFVASETGNCDKGGCPLDLDLIFKDPSCETEPTDNVKTAVKTQPNAVFHIHT